MKRRKPSLKVRLTFTVKYCATQTIPSKRIYRRQDFKLIQRPD